MNGTIMQPTPEIIRAAAILNKAVERLVNAIKKMEPIGTYEADVEAFNLLKLIIRHVEGVASLASNDLALLPSAMVLARASLEIAIKLKWMTAPEDPFQREVRWLAHLQSEEDYFNKLAAQLGKLGSGDAQQKIADQIREFRIQVAAKLPNGVTPLTRMPNLYQMLESLQETEKYLAYIIGCQFSHGTHHATSIYRKNLGSEKILGEHIVPGDWGPCFSITWYSLHASGEQFLRTVGVNTDYFLPIEFGIEVEAAIEAVTNG